jgi:hypothetical protein
VLLEKLFYQLVLLFLSNYCLFYSLLQEEEMLVDAEIWCGASLDQGLVGVDALCTKREKTTKLQL